MVREIIEGLENTRFDRAHFKEYGDSSLDFEVVYYVRSPDYNVYMDIQQDINLALFEQFTQAGIDFAYPTRTLYVTQTGAAPAAAPGST
jgi:small-conductance mechanosensitive channel